ncbi:MAG: hypothetical protein LBC13_01630 [Clostridiales bacterium]|nr:hypothetical protein [Clostridiales bacterium]
MIKENLWVGALLASYTFLPKLAKSVDKAIKARVKSGFMSQHLNYGISAEELVVSLIALNERKVLLINTKVIVDEICSKLKTEDLKLLRLRYFEHKQFSDIAVILNCALRTVFRRHDRLLQHAAFEAERFGYGKSWFNEKCAEDSFFAALLDRLGRTDRIDEEERERNDEVSGKRTEKELCGSC